MKKATFLILIVLLVSGCVDEGGKWQQATVTSINQTVGNILVPSYTIVMFNDTFGNIYVTEQPTFNPFRYPEMYELEINKTYLVHVTESGNVDKVGFEGD